MQYTYSYFMLCTYACKKGVACSVVWCFLVLRCVAWSVRFPTCVCFRWRASTPVCSPDSLFFLTSMMFFTAYIASTIPHSSSISHFLFSPHPSSFYYPFSFIIPPLSPFLHIYHSSSFSHPFSFSYPSEPMFRFKFADAGNMSPPLISFSEVAFSYSGINIPHS